MDRIVGIDYGRKRVGVAVSDPLGIFASALDTVHSAKIIEYLENYARKRVRVGKLFRCYAAYNLSIF